MFLHKTQFGHESRNIFDRRRFFAVSSGTMVMVDGLLEATAPVR